MNTLTPVFPNGTMVRARPSGWDAPDPATDDAADDAAFNGTAPDDIPSLAGWSDYIEGALDSREIPGSGGTTQLQYTVDDQGPVDESTIEKLQNEDIVAGSAGVIETVPQRLVNVDTAVVPHVSIEAARTYLQTAQNRLVGVGDDLWGHMRDQMLEGLQAGEGSYDIAKRLRTTANMAKPRANVIARTEVIGATNRGAYSQMLATGLSGKKTWLATGDSRTRPSHAAATGQAADMPATFTVGGHKMDGPHDPMAPPSETINCRCTLTYEVDPPESDVPTVTMVKQTFDDKLAEAEHELNAERAVSSSLETLTDERQIHAINRYIDFGYRGINNKLRRHELLDPTQSTSLYIKRLDEIFANSKTSVPIVSYRGLIDPEAMLGSAWGEFDLTGLEWVDEGFSSASAIRSVAKDFAMRLPDNSLLMRIIIPKDYKVFSIGGSEHELLFNRGTKFRVIRDNGHPERGMRLLDVEVVT